MADIFREVDEEVRRDKALETWERYQSWFIAAGLLVIAATGAYRAYDYYRVKAEETAGMQYEAAVQTARAGNSAEAQAALEAVAKTGPDGYKSLALMRDAGVIAAGDPAGGVAAFDALAKNPALAAPFQDVARLRAALLRADEADAKEMSARLEPMAGEGKPYRHTARELLAVAAIKAGDLAAAGRWLDQMIVDPQTPADARKRAEELSGLVLSGKPATAAR